MYCESSGYLEAASRLVPRSQSDCSSTLSPRAKSRDCVDFFFLFFFFLFFFLILSSNYRRGYEKITYMEGERRQTSQSSPTRDTESHDRFLTIDNSTTETVDNHIP